MAGETSSAPRSRSARPVGGGRDAGAGRPRRWGPPRRKVCRFCVDHAVDVDFKNVTVLRNFVTERGKMISARTVGNCARHQRMLTRAIKRARNLALLPYSVV